MLKHRCDVEGVVTGHKLNDCVCLCACFGEIMRMETMLALARVLFLFDIEIAGTLGEGVVRVGR